MGETSEIAVQIIEVRSWATSGHHYIGPSREPARYATVGGLSLERLLLAAIDVAGN